MRRLDNDEWRRVDALFSRIMDLAPAERERSLEASGEPERVLARVRRLLDSTDDAAEHIGESVGDLSAELVGEFGGEDADDLDSGASLGPYRIVREVGRGGMGTVYLAERGDGTYDRRVALKVVKRGMDTDEVVSRFRREGRILARLEHPRIGRMYDADVAPDGRPYLVLEYIDGTEIDRYADEHHLTVDARVRLFVEVCSAVSFAHGKLVLHRDLKPSNILVTEDGPKLLDFGVAKVLGEGETETRPLTALMGPRLTPEYAAPEQLSGAPVSTATDVYALGVVLYELLTGVRPSDDGRPASQAVTTAGGEADTRERARQRSSTPHRLSKRLDGDLDVVLAKALHTDPARRYPSVEAFSADLSRHLEGLPVSARPDSVPYRVRKFVTRHRLPVASGTGIGLSILAFGIASAFQQAQTNRALQEAQAERARAEEVTGVLEEMFTGAGFDSEGRVDTLRVADFLDATAQSVIDSLDHQPVVQATLLRILGNARHGYGQLDEADSLLSRAVLVLEEPGVQGERALLHAKRDLASLRLRQGRIDEARSLYESWLTAGFDLSADDVAEVQHNLGIAHLQSGAFEDAASRLDSSIAIHRADPTMNPIGFGRSLTMRAGVAQRLGAMDEALAFAEESVGVMTDALGPEHPGTMMTEHNFAFMIYRSGDPERAAPIFQELLARYEASVGSSVEMPTLLQNYGSVLRELGRAEEALPLHRRAVDMERASSGADVTYALDALAATLEALDRPVEAAEALEEGVDLALTFFGPEHPNTAIARYKFASAHCSAGLGREDETLRTFADSEEILRRVFPPDHPALGDLTRRRDACLTLIGG